MIRRVINKFRKSSNDIQRQILSKEYGTIVKQFDEFEFYVFKTWIEIINRNMPDVGIVYDIGANTGLTSEIFSLYTKNSVYSFEPIPSMIKRIEERGQRNNLIQIQPIACGDKIDTLTFNENQFAASSSFLEMCPFTKNEWDNLTESSSYQIHTYPIDDWRKKQGLPQPSLMLIDVQGFENKVLTGAKETLVNTKYVWIEMNFQNLYKNGSTFHSIYTQLVENNFEMIDCVDFVYSRQNKKLLYFDGIFKNKKIC